VRVYTRDGGGQLEYLDARVTAQDLYIVDLEHCVRQLQQVVRRFQSSAIAAAGLLPDDLCDVLVPRRPAVCRQLQHNSGTHRAQFVVEARTEGASGVLKSH